MTGTSAAWTTIAPEGQGSFVSKWQRAFRDSSTSGAGLIALGLVLSLNAHFEDGTRAYPSKRSLAAWIGCTRDTVRANMLKLIDAGWVQPVAVRDSGVVEYRLTFPRALAEGGPVASRGVPGDKAGGTGPEVTPRRVARHEVVSERVTEDDTEGVIGPVVSEKATDDSDEGARWEQFLRGLDSAPANERKAAGYWEHDEAPSPQVPEAEPTPRFGRARRATADRSAGRNIDGETVGQPRSRFRS